MSFDRLASAVAKRNVSSRSGSELELELSFGSPLDKEVLARIALEGQQAAAQDGILGVEASETKVRITMQAPLAGTVRASTLLRVERSDELAAYLAEAAARCASTRKRPHTKITLDTLLIKRTGEVILLGSELPALHALIAPPCADPADRWRTLAPEAGRGELADAVSDVYAIGALYFHALTGAPYRGSFNAIEASLACVEDAPPDLPAWLRPSLLALLSSTLSPDRSDRPSDLAAAIRAELWSVNKTMPTHAQLAAKIAKVSDPLHALYGAEPARFQRGVPLRVKPIEERTKKLDNERSLELNAEAFVRAPRSR